ncbi:recombinase family protein [Acholeplasma laidlawii]|uniref:Serine recombinase, site-specific n=2 Tax=Acholeplasma laidlawii TaxID=2148 RepID=A9NH65_ACHLI|nr:recombinase family protein [Acholeplasma laidlawii]ABX81695.1 serine recombinase, site-specific [Acholeplasma laidlawii PG-8A]NWH09728.1 recombinase family protein [Acholeplasma laidlawii]NWH11119.1 recombinase family protein [Acholeplasma laidlawii]NWH13470.1 recombinase family protein [Acholeplasma laidlawii]NWH14551.1 recombinase family protein [Acholeplasma laidlawii]
MTYAYIRVSSKTQLIDRQLSEIHKLNIPNKNIFVDKESGKDFNRKQYKRLKSKLKKDDLVVIKSIDRLGRNYQMIIDEWAYITRTVGADIRVLDMPLLDTRSHPENLVGKFISDIVLQILSFVAENERDNIKQRQAEGIRIAKEKGIHMGRPRYVKPDNFDDIVSSFKNKQISLNEAISTLELSKSTFYKYL